MMAGWLFAQRRSVGEQHDWIDRQLVFLVQPREIAQHPATKMSICRGLMFDVYQEERWLIAKLGLHDNVGLATLATRDIGKQLFVEKCHTIGLKVAGDSGKE